MTTKASLARKQGTPLAVSRTAIRNAVVARNAWRKEISRVQVGKAIELKPQSPRSTSRTVYFVKSNGPFGLVSKLERDMKEVVELSKMANSNRHRRPKELWTPSIVTDPQKITIVMYDVLVKKSITRAQAIRFAAKAGVDVALSDSDFILWTLTGPKYVMRVMYEDGAKQDFDLREWNVCVWTKAGPPPQQCVVHDVRGAQKPEGSIGNIQEGDESEKFRRICTYKRSVLYAHTSSGALTDM